MAATKIERIDAVGVIHLDDGKANALSIEVCDELDAALTDLAADEAVKAVVIAGRDGKFSAGFHLPTMQSDRVMELLGKGGNLGARIFAYPKPVVLAVTGHALAMGAVLLMCADERIGARGDFKVGLNEVRIGLALPPMAARLAEYRLSRRHLTQATQLADIYTPDQAADIGFLDRVVEPAEVLDTALARAAQLAADLDPGAFLATREFVRGPLIASLGDMLGAAPSAD